MWRRFSQTRNFKKRERGRCSARRQVLVKFAFAVATVSAWIVIGPLVAVAQKAPEVGYVFPPVVAVGQVSEVTFGGFDWTDDSEIHIDDARLVASRQGELGPFLVPRPPYWFGPKGRSTAMPIPREISYRLQVPGDIGPGPQYWQISNANGVSATSAFGVSSDRQIVEDRDRDAAINIGTLPVGVSGRLGVIAEEDRYFFDSDRDGVVTIRWRARQFGADFHGAIVVTDAAGRVLADRADTSGDDGAVTFAIQKGERYAAKFFDVDFRGNRAYVYHLTFDYAGHADVVAPVPAPGIAGANTGAAKQTFVVIGSGLDGTEAATETHLRPEEIGSLSATAPIVGWPDAQPWASTELTLMPGQGVFRTLRLIEDRNEIGILNLLKGEALEVEALCRRLGASADVEVAIEDEAGKVVASQDDGIRTSDASVLFVAKADGKHTIVVNELSGNTGPKSVCFVIARRSKPGFRLSTAQRSAIPVGGKLAMTVNIAWLGGLSAPLTLECRGLPNGVTLEAPAEVKPGAKTAKLTLIAAEETAAQSFQFEIWGSAETPAGVVEVQAAADLDGDLVCWDPAAARTTRLRGVTTLKAPVKVELIDKNRQRAVHRGTTYPAPFVVARDEGYQGEVLLQMAARQSRHRQGIDGPIVRVPGDVRDVLYPCFLPEWLETDRTTRMVVMGVAMVDDHGVTRQILAPADARITMILEGALLKVKQQLVDRHSSLGDSFEVPFEIARAAKLQEPVVVQLIVPDALKGFVKAEPVSLAPGVDRGVLLVHTTKDDRCLGRWIWQLRAEAKEAGQWLVVAVDDAEVELRGQR